MFQRGWCWTWTHETREILRGDLQRPRRVRAIIWVIICSVAAGHYSTQCSLRPLYLPQHVSAWKSLRNIRNIKNARPELNQLFSFFSHLLKPNVCSRLPLSWLTKDWYSLKGPFPPLWDSKEDLSQLECWIVNTNATQANKPRWASLFRASESEWRQTTVSIFVSSIRKWMKWAWQLTLLKRSGRTPREACKAQWRTNRIYNFNWFYFCLYLQLSLPAFIKKGYGHRNWVGKLNREVGKAYFS